MSTAETSLSDEIRQGLADAEETYASVEASTGLGTDLPDPGPCKLILLEIELRRSVFRFGDKNQAPATVIQRIYEGLTPEGKTKEYRGESVYIPDGLSKLKAKLPDRGRGSKGILEASMGRLKGANQIIAEALFGDEFITGGLIQDITAVNEALGAGHVVELDVNIRQNDKGYKTDFVNGASLMELDANLEDEEGDEDED
jgi:hypothetical protein